MKTKIVSFMVGLVIALTSFQVISVVAEDVSKKGEHVSDTWLQTKLVTTYSLNRHLSIFDIDVDVRDQTAYLGGVVDSSIEKDLAEEVALTIDGMKGVKNSIVVNEKDAEGRAEKLKDSFFQKVDDLTITASIKSKLLANSSIDGMDVNVDTKGSKVMLKGVVSSDVERELAEKIALNTRGVTEVENNLEITSKES